MGTPTSFDVPTPRLAEYTTGGFDRGRSALVEFLWIVVQSLFVRSFLPGSSHRCWLLKMFGARLGRGVVVKPGVRVKFPWRLSVGDYSWIGEDAWIDNLAPVTVGANCCLSQGAYLCTGNHDWSALTFDLRTGPISLEDGAWVAARATVGPGITVGRNAVVALGATVTEDVPAGRIAVAGMTIINRMRTVGAKST